VIKRQQGLNDTRDPEKADKAGNEKEHLPRTDFGYRKFFSKNNADDEEDNESHQLKKLQPRNIVY